MFVIFKESFFSDTHFIIMKGIPIHDKNAQKIVIIMAKCPKSGEFQGILFFSFFAAVCRIPAKSFFFAKNSLLAP